MNSTGEVKIIEQFLERMNRDTSLNVSAVLKKKPEQGNHWSTLLFAPCVRFARSYTANRNHGKRSDRFIRAALDAISILALSAKVWETRMRQREGKSQLPPLTTSELEQFNRL